MRKSTKWGFGIDIYKYAIQIALVWRMPDPETVPFLFGIGGGEGGTNFFGTQRRVWFYLYLFNHRIINLSIPLGPKKLYLMQGSIK